MKNAHHRLLVMPLLVAAVALGVFGPRTALADEITPLRKGPRSRMCCALATHLPLHLGASHVPLLFGTVGSPSSIGPHSYLGDSATPEKNGIIYTRRGGFIDTGHMREQADVTARVAVQIKPLLQRGEGVLRLRPRDGLVTVRVKARVPDALLDSTAARLAQRIAFQASVWVEISQHYGHNMMRGAEEYFSAFTPEDLYSNLLGTYLGASAVLSELPYDRAMDARLADMFESFEALPMAETRRILTALMGRWWRSDTPWPSPAIPLARSFDIGPHVVPMQAPPDLVPPAEPIVLDVPEVDDNGAPLTDLYRLEIFPDLHTLPRLAGAGAFPVVTGDDLPRLVATARKEIEAGKEAAGAAPANGGEDPSGPVAHYLVGLRLVELKAMGGVAAPLSGDPKGVFGGSLIGLRADTRGGDFDLIHLDLNHTAERGIISGFSLFRSNALFACRDPETNRLRAPLLSLLGPCKPGEWLGIGGSLGEAFHDGRTGRTALRPISLYGVVDVLGNGQSPSYDGLRFLLRGGGAVEHVWTQAEGGVTIPRVGGGTVVLVRSRSRSLEVAGAAGYRLDPSTPRDAAFESSASVRWYFLIGGNRSAKLVDGVDPWGVGSIGLEGGYSYWTRPAHSYADMALPFVSAQHSGTWQALITATLGFEGLTF